MSFIDQLKISEGDDVLLVNSRERRNLEFKEHFTPAIMKKCLKTFCAFANTIGGMIVFGISDKPRRITGVDETAIWDEARVSDFLAKHTCPVPNFSMFEERVGDILLLCIEVEAKNKPPVLAIKDAQDINGNIVFSGGCVYYRKTGQSIPSKAEHYLDMLQRRDEYLTNNILGTIENARNVGFEKVGVADMSQGIDTGVPTSLIITKEVAQELNVIERGKLVNKEGSPAYELIGTLQYGVFSPDDPRGPMLAGASVDALHDQIIEIFWEGFPWSPHHIRRAATHLGFWNDDGGDETHTSHSRTTNSTLYLEVGRLAILDFARRKPREFVEVVGSRKTIAELKEKLPIEASAPSELH